MKSISAKAARMCVFAVVTVGLSLAAVLSTYNVARAESWCVTVGQSQECFPTMAACKAAHPTRDCVRGPG
jgi:hypothetical protein